MLSLSSTFLLPGPSNLLFWGQISPVKRQCQERRALSILLIVADSAPGAVLGTQ